MLYSTIFNYYPFPLQPRDINLSEPNRDHLDMEIE